MPALRPREPQCLWDLVATLQPPELGPESRPGVLPLDLLTQKLNGCLSGSTLPPNLHQPIRAAILLWHDHLDASHRIAQELPGSDGSLLHGVMHRREPDYANAKYWFQRAGQHRSFSELAKKAAALLQAAGQRELCAELIPGGAWDPFAFVDACQRAAHRPVAAAQTQLLREIQASELEILLAQFCCP